MWPQMYVGACPQSFHSIHREAASPEPLRVGKEADYNCPSDAMYPIKDRMESKNAYIDEQHIYEEYEVIGGERKKEEEKEKSQSNLNMFMIKYHQVRLSPVVSIISHN